MKPSSLGRLAATGGTIGPLVDAIHNQALLEYDLYPVTLIDAKTSLLIPPLLGITYVVLGGILPPLSQKIFGESQRDNSLLSFLDTRSKALAAVLSTCAIIRLSLYVGLGPLALAAFAQWLLLDASRASFFLALLVSIGGPIAEIPFEALGCWHYLQPDYFPLDGLVASLSPEERLATGISSITGPCYFAVTTDAIALGRYFDNETDD